MKLNCEGLPTIYLKPCEIWISKSPSVVSTVLGSCISVTMFSPQFKVGAICHGFLPTKSSTCENDEVDVEEYKYVDQAIVKMAKRLKHMGVRAGELEVKLFGGAHMFSSRSGSRKIDVGIQNIQTAILTIKSSGLKLHSTHVGGVAGRKLYFNTETGEVYMTLIDNGISTEDVLRCSEQII